MADDGAPPASTDAERPDPNRGATPSAGEALADGEPMLLLFSGREAERLASLDEGPERLGRSKLLWVDVGAPSERVAEAVAEKFELDQVATRALASTSARPGFRDAGRFVHLTVKTPADEAGEALREVECVVGENWVVTAHDGPVTVLDEFAELASGSGATGELNGPTFLAALLEWVLNGYATAFERLEGELEEFDERAMQGKRKPEQEIETLVGLRRRAAHLRHSLSAHRSALLALSQPELEALGDEASGRRFQVLLERFDTTAQAGRDVRESIFSSFDVLIARTGHQTNEIMKILTLASVILLPGSVLAGVMGMNFKVGLFDNPNIFWVVLAAILAVAVVTLAVAKHRDWI